MGNKLYKTDQAITEARMLFALLKPLPFLNPIMKNYFLRRVRAVATIAAVAALYTGPAHAIVVGSDQDVNFTGSSVRFGYLGQFFTLFDTSMGPFDFSPVSISTAGTAQVNSIFGKPTSYFDPIRGFVIFDGSLQYTSFPNPTVIDFSAAPTFIGLRLTAMDGGVHYGYAEFDGTLLEAYAFESAAGIGILPGAPIVAGIPEPSELALLSLGIVAAAALRRRRKN